MEKIDNQKLKGGVINMTNNLEGSINELQTALDNARNEPRCKAYLGFGERILELVREKDYAEARFVANAFRDATLTFWKGELAPQLMEYIQATVKLLNSI